MDTVIECPKSETGALCIGILCPFYDKCFPAVKK